jgi:fructose-specific phosphotransferase system IIC component
MKHIIWVLWPAFIAAGVAEIVFFTVIDPQQLYLFGRAVQLPAIATYSIGFLMFWLICAGSSLMTFFMLPKEVKSALQRHAGEHHDLARPKRNRLAAD